MKEALKQRSSRKKFLLLSACVVLILLGIALRPRKISQQEVWEDDGIIGRSVMSLRLRYGWEAESNYTAMCGPDLVTKKWNLQNGGELEVVFAVNSVLYHIPLIVHAHSYRVRFTSSPLLPQDDHQRMILNVQPGYDSKQVPSEPEDEPPRFLRQDQIVSEYHLDGRLWSLVSPQGKITIGTRKGSIGAHKGTRLAIHLSPPARPGLWETVLVQWFSPVEIEPVLEKTHEGSSLVIKALPDHRELMRWDVAAFYHLPAPGETIALR